MNGTDECVGSCSAVRTQIGCLNKRSAGVCSWSSTIFSHSEVYKYFVYLRSFGVFLFYLRSVRVNPLQIMQNANYENGGKNTFRSLWLDCPSPRKLTEDNRAAGSPQDRWRGYINARILHMRAKFCHSIRLWFTIDTVIRIKSFAKRY